MEENPEEKLSTEPKTKNEETENNEKAENKDKAENNELATDLVEEQKNKAVALELKSQGSQFYKEGLFEEAR